MRTLNNFNQLLFRVKSIFSRKAAPVATAIQTEAAPTDLSEIGRASCRERVSLYV